MRRTNSRRKNQQSNETGGLSFAVTLLAALVGTSLYTKNYVQTTPIDPVLWYLLVRILISAALILAGGLLLYILIEGFSIEVHEHEDHDQKNHLKERASKIYLATFFCSAVLLTFLVLVCIFSLIWLKLLETVPQLLLTPKILLFWGFKPLFAFLFLPIVACWTASLYLNLNLDNTIFFFILFILIFIAFFIVWYVFDLQDKIWLSTYRIGFLIAVLFFAIIQILIVPNLTMLQGHVTVDMESIYYKNDAPIPVLIHVTGPNYNLSIKLQNSTKVVYNLELTPERNLSKTVFRNNSFLIGNALNYGTYNVFINTTNLSAGYYELVCKRPKYDKTYGARGFYLLNSS